MSVGWLDLVNGGFELGGALVIWLNFLRLRRDMRIRGVDWRVTGFFGAWGLWNLVF